MRAAVITNLWNFERLHDAMFFFLPVKTDNGRSFTTVEKLNVTDSLLDLDIVRFLVLIGFSNKESNKTFAPLF